MTEHARIIRCDDLLEADVNGEIVALHVEKGQCYGMNGVASRVWELLAEPMARGELCAKLTAEFDAVLFRNAAARGATTLEGTRVTEVSSGTAGERAAVT